MNPLSAANYHRLDLPTIMRRAWRDAATEVPYVPRYDWQAILVSFISRVTSGEIFWR